jgi:hypothetical protein
MHLRFLSIDQRLHEYAFDLFKGAAMGSISKNKILLAGWIYHDLSLEGAVFRNGELNKGLCGLVGQNWLENQLIVRVAGMAKAIDFIAQYASGVAPFDLEFIKNVHRSLRDDADSRSGKYRKEDPPNSVYRHDSSPVGSISYRMRMLSASLSERSALHPIQIACSVHRQLMETFPFDGENAVVARLVMNACLLRWGYPPCVFSISDRQQYFSTYLGKESRYIELVVRSMLQVIEGQKREDMLSSAAPTAYDTMGAMHGM